MYYKYSTIIITRSTVLDFDVVYGRLLNHAGLHQSSVQA